MQWVNDPMREFDRMRRVMDKMYSRVPFFGTTEYQFPLVNLYDSRDVLYVVAEIPGVPKENIEINYQDGSLSITGKREQKKYGQSEMLRQEQPQGGFEKIIRVPISIKANEIKAKFEDGLLSISLPKAEEAKPRQITVEI